MVNDKKKIPNPFQYRTTLHIFPFAMTIATGIGAAWILKNRIRKKSVDENQTLEKKDSNIINEEKRFQFFKCPWQIKQTQL